MIDREREVFRHDANHLVLRISKLQRFAGQRRISREMRAPQIVTEHYNRWRRCPFIVFREVAAEQRFLARDSERRCRHLRTACQFSPTIRAAYMAAAAARSAQLRTGLAPPAPRRKIVERWAPRIRILPHLD